MFAPLPNFALNANGKCLNLSKPKVMGILNVTPDSFSDGGRFVGIDAALARVQAMVDEGVHLVDIGAESTRPNATFVDEALELARLSDIVKEVRRQFPKLWLSIDTSSPAVMAQMADLGVDMWNDIRGLRRAGAAQMAASLGLPVVIMHSRGEPSTMARMAVYDEVVSEVASELQRSVQTALSAGVKHENIIVDIGMGFAKTHEHHVSLMKNLKDIDLGYPMLFGVSRKRFVGEILAKTRLEQYQDSTPHERDAASAALAVFAMAQGAAIIRTHNVAQTIQAAAVWSALADKPEDD